MSSSRRRPIRVSVPMPELRLQTRPIALAALLAGLLLAGVGGWIGGVPAAVAACLAQPAVALGVSAPL